MANSQCCKVFNMQAIDYRLTNSTAEAKSFGDRNIVFIESYLHEGGHSTPLVPFVGRRPVYSPLFPAIPSHVFQEYRDCLKPPGCSGGAL